jgi:hypothetical protein
MDSTSGDVVPWLALDQMIEGELFFCAAACGLAAFHGG